MRFIIFDGAAGGDLRPYGLELPDLPVCQWQIGRFRIPLIRSPILLENIHRILVVTSQASWLGEVDPQNYVSTLNKKCLIGRRKTSRTSHDPHPMNLMIRGPLMGGGSELDPPLSAEKLASNEVLPSCFAMGL